MTNKITDDVGEPVFYVSGNDMNWLSEFPASNAAITAFRKPGAMRVPVFLHAAQEAAQPKPEQAVGDGLVDYEPTREMLREGLAHSYCPPMNAERLIRIYSAMRALEPTPRPAPVEVGDGLDLLQLIRDARHRICNDAPSGIGRRPFDHPVYGPLLRRLDAADAYLSTPRPAVATPLELRICELRHTIVQRDRPYIFTVDPNCEGCREVAQFGHNYRTVATPAEVTDEKKLFEAAYYEVTGRPITIHEIAWRMWQKRAALAQPRTSNDTHHKAWLAIVDTLNHLEPDWYSDGDDPAHAACAAIRSLADRPRTVEAAQGGVRDNYTPTDDEVPPADSREAFEEWITTRPWFARAKMRMDKASDGSYKDFRVNDRWAAFQQGVKFGHDSVNTNV